MTPAVTAESSRGSKALVFQGTKLGDRAHGKCFSCFQV